MARTWKYETVSPQISCLSVVVNCFAIGSAWNSPLLGICCKTYCDDTTGLKGNNREMYVRLVTGTGEPTSGGNGLEGGAGTEQENFIDVDGNGYPDDLPDDATVS
eukprot:GHVO01012360.1.p1 GENE.GHVO01012360.1~~GHVO01012360.1.p1  ORF type:complete len:123 (+),score=8.13 GHVO01012360.1:56-370(+)